MTIFFQHGWGFDHTVWQKWLPLIPEGTSYQLGERGYFYGNQRGTVNQPRVIITHSFGLHLIPESILDRCSLLVCISGFSTFPTRQREKMDVMTRYLRQENPKVLEQFYGKMGLSFQKPKNINWTLLCQDLEKMKKSSRLPTCGEILYLHGEIDRVVPAPEDARIIPEGTHALPLTHAKCCWEIIVKRLFKNEVALNFSGAAATYEANTPVQKQAANLLCQELEKIPLPAGDILEIGCGTGYITQNLLKKFLDRQLLITDLSPGMVEHCQKNGVERAQYRVMDGEKIEDSKKWAIIISGMTVQWFCDLERSLEKLQERVLPGGTLLFSCLEESSFPEWKQACRDCGVPYTALPLPKKEEIQKALPEALFQEKRVRQSYPSPSYFFRTLQKLGGQTTPHQQLTVPEYKKLVATWKETCTITYTILTVISRQLSE